MDGKVVRYRPTSLMTRVVSMPIGEPDGHASPRPKRIVKTFRSAGINANAASQMEAWLKTHAAFEVPPRGGPCMPRVAPSLWPATGAPSATRSVS